MKTRNYFAFISYKREGIDEKVANWVHLKLEKYPYPKELVAEENRPEDDERIRKVFIDTKELSVTNDSFSNEIKHAIKSARYLILICSGRAALSTYVAKEVEYFLETHGNDTSLILPIFIDSVDESYLPTALRGKGILERNCPIYKSFLDARNEINLYCFYHIVAFLLKVDFNKIYDRYGIYSQRKRRQNRRLKTFIYTMIALLFAVLGDLIYSQYKVVKKQEEIVQLEKEIFPYSVVMGYVGNFLSPVIDYMKEKEPTSHIYVHMPTRVKDLEENHKLRFDSISPYIERTLSLDSISQVTLKTRMPRGSRVHRLYSSSNERLNNQYLDFASTTSTFLAIANKKKGFGPYKDVDVESLIREYTDIFIKQVNEELKGDSIHVTFITSIADIPLISNP